MALRIQHHFRLSTAFSTRLTASGRLTPHVWRRMLTSQLPEHRKHDKERVIILGSGWAGFRMLRSLNCHAYDVVLVSPRNHFVFTPLLASTAVGTLEFRCITEPIRSFANNVTYYEAKCDDVDFKAKKIRCVTTVPGSDKTRTYELSYDRLVLAVGSYAQTFNVPGVREHAFFFREVNDARSVRRRIIDCLERAAQPNISEEEQRRLLHFAVVGGGPTGVELSAEITDLIRQDISRSYPRLSKLWRLSLYDVAPKILGGFDEKLSVYTTKKFQRQGINVCTGSVVEAVRPDAIVIKGVGPVPCGMVVWSTGLTPNPLIDKLGDRLLRNRSGRLITDRRMTVIDRQTGRPLEGVHALGDCATIQDQDLPATAQVANQEAGYLSRALNKLVRERRRNPDAAVVNNIFHFRNLGMMAYIGGNRAIAEYKLPTKVIQSGFLAWVMWRSAYLTYSVSWRNKFLILMHWTIKSLFGRDISRF